MTTFPSLLRWNTAQGFLIVAVCAGLVPVLVHLDRPLAVLPFVVMILGGIALTLLPSPKLIQFYLCYLICDGGLKIWTNYNPVIHVGSDLLLIVAFLRLCNRRLRAPGTFVSDHDAARRARLVSNFLVVFWLWVAVQILNPWSLGVLPWLAALKLYAVPMLIFFAVAFLLTDEEVRAIPFLLLILGILEATFALVDWTKGPGWLASFNPSYARITFEFLKGFPYRPFGTGHLPGVPSVWMGQIVVSAFLVIELCRAKSVPPRVALRWRVAFFTFLILALATLVACQVRISIVRFFILIVFGFALRGWKPFVLSTACGAALMILSALNPPGEVGIDFSAKVSLEARALQALARVQTLDSITTYKTARGGTFAIDEAFRRAVYTTQGIGLSRISASSRPWADRIARDPYFGSSWGFSDNLYLALFTELGLGGLAAYLLLVAIILWHLKERRTYCGRLVAVYILGTLAAGYASEGILYQPDASCFWLYVALGLRLKDGQETPGSSSSA